MLAKSKIVVSEWRSIWNVRLFTSEPIVFIVSRRSRQKDFENRRPEYLFSALFLYSAKEIPRTVLREYSPRENRFLRDNFTRPEKLVSRNSFERMDF